jgi:hypothetical protein
MTEQEARAIASRATGLYAAGFISADDVDAKIAEAFAQHRAAVRAETLREVRGIIADVKAGGDDFADNADEKFGWDQACDCVHNSLALKDTLTALAHPEGTDK